MGIPKRKFRLSFLNIDLDLGRILDPSWLPCPAGRAPDTSLGTATASVTEMDATWAVSYSTFVFNWCFQEQHKRFHMFISHQILSVFLHLGTGMSLSRDAQARNSRAQHQPVSDQFSCSSFLWLLPVALMAISRCTAFALMQGGYVFLDQANWRVVALGRRNHRCNGLA